MKFSAKIEDNHNSTKQYKSVLYAYKHNYRSVYTQVRCRLMLDKHVQSMNIIIRHPRFYAIYFI